ncbi:helix-turn-helix domain-containing protein [Enterobacter sp. R4-368]|uniref:helix-turn-helix domain-containing protein n=1 Tax=Enterobacter sp. R4-368 TaxID=1166130 RepID=UPI00034EE2FE|nr:helix-turn-helix domain-containing protein [Enterobacter sp. R4-368]AGN86689.1 XRE family transcriptional regulator [Enterobacter sp. R4-368]
MIEDAIKAADELVKQVPFLGNNPGKEEYEQALEMVERLLMHAPDSSLAALLTAKIEHYENNDPELAAFNARIAALPRGVAALRVLMDQHGLNQSSFRDEIGQRSLVSRILNGERNLTVDHIRALAKRFNVSTDVFIEPAHHIAG